MHLSFFPQLFLTFACLSYLPFPFFLAYSSSQLLTAYCAFSFLFLRPFLPFFRLTPALSFSLRIAPFPSLFFLAFSAFSFPFPVLLQLLAFHCILPFSFPFLCFFAFTFLFPGLLLLLAFHCVLRLFLPFFLAFALFPPLFLSNSRS